MSSGFGSATTDAFESKINWITSESNTSPNILKILSGSLWCKGYAGLYAGVTPSFDAMLVSIVNARIDVGLGSSAPGVDAKFMRSLLSMDAYKVPLFSEGSGSIREVQQWMNRTYSTRRDFNLIPCDGVFSRQVQTALLLSLQYEFGMLDGVANGNFGPGTREQLAKQATVRIDDVDSSRNFVRLYQATLRFNHYDVTFNGTFDSLTSTCTENFQRFMELPVTKVGDYTTWCNLLVSSGDTTIKTKGFDTNKQLTLAMAMEAATNGYTHVGRYTVGREKFITASELDSLRKAGLRLVPLHQRFNNNVSTMTYEAGRIQGREAIERGRVLGFPDGTTIYFSVDFDPVGEVIKGPVTDFFTGIKDVMESVLETKFRVGIYGTRNTCQLVINKKKAESAYVAGMSTGFSGNMGFPMPTDWHYNQIVEVTESLGGTRIGIDHVVVSSKAASVDLTSLVTPPVELVNGDRTETGFDIIFEWSIKAEVECEIALKKASTPIFRTDLYAPLIYQYILDWLRSDEYTGLAWQAYLVAIDTSELAAASRAVCLQALGSMTPAVPNTSDPSHWAATALGYIVWGLPTEHGNYGLGDLGGWPLDLLQVWGSYLNDKITQDLEPWAKTQVGGSLGSFGYEDFIADADAWLLVKELQTTKRLSESLRRLQKYSPNMRIKKFYNERFGGSEQNVIDAFQRVADGIEVGSVENFPFTDEVLKRLSGSERLPSPAEARILGSVYAQALERLGSNE